MQDDPPQDEPEESQSENSDVKDSGFLLPIEVICDPFGLESEIKASDDDLGEYLYDVEEYLDAATMLGTANEFDLDAELEDDIEDAMHPNAKEFDLDAEPKEIDPDLEGSSQDELEDKEHLMPFFSLFACFILMVICAGFLISMFLGYV